MTKAHCQNSSTPFRTHAATCDGKQDTTKIGGRATACLCCYPYHDHDRRSLIQRYSARCYLLPAAFIPVVSGITHQHTSVPHAPCRYTRALLRTSLANLGLRTAMIAILIQGDEGRCLLHASPATVCNLVNQEPPPPLLPSIKPFLEQGFATRRARLP